MTGLTEDQLAALWTIAEDPLAVPSRRVEARKLLKAWRDAHDDARGAELRRRIQDAKRSGRGLTWRERAIAVKLGMIRPDHD